MQHFILLLNGSKPIGQSPQRLKVKENQKIKQQLVVLMQKGLVATADRAWSSSVVLVQKDRPLLAAMYRLLEVAAFIRKDVYRLPE